MSIFSKVTKIFTPKQAPVNRAETMEKRYVGNPSW